MGGHSEHRYRGEAVEAVASEPSPDAPAPTESALGASGPEAARTAFVPALMSATSIAD